MEPDKPQGIDYAAVLADLEKKRDELDTAIAVIKLHILGYPAGSAPVAATDPATKAQPAVPAGIGDHTFFGMTIAKAAETYLLIKKKPATALEMAGALVDGGFVSQSDNLASTITTALYRNPDMFVRVKRGTWGLKAWYPNYRPPAD